MNILYITHEYGDRWGKYATFLRELGHTVNLIILKDKQTPNQVTVAQYSSKYDIVWLFAADYIYCKVLTDDFIDAVKKEGSIFVGYCTLSTKVPFKEWVNNYKVFDICFLHSKLVTEMAEADGLTNVFYMPYGFDKEEYYKINIKKKFNVSFMGSAQTNKPPEEDNRAQIINALKEFGIRVFGGSLKGRVHKSIKVSRFSKHKEMNRVFNQSKINLNIPIINTNLSEFLNKYHPKNRFYEIPGSGNFMISGYADEFNDQFNDGIHCSYYNNINDLCSKVEYYLTHEEEREDIGLEGYNHALKYHQTKFRFRDMMNIIEERYF
ncbi:MAG: glycosyltransferase family protein [Planctomycetota bacterium]|jgi:spore maturation protein CgeB